MNPDATDTRSPHLDVADLVASANGQQLDDRARDHLAGCEECQLEEARWALVANGVRGLATDVPNAEPPSQPGAARQYSRPARRRLPRPARRVLQVAGGTVAAVAVLFGAGLATGNVHVSLNRSGPSASTLASVSGCAQLEQAAGTLERVDGTSVVIKAANGQLVTVTTTAATRMAASGALLGDITDGATVLVAGTSVGGAVAAEFVIVGGNPSLSMPNVVIVQGTVSHASAAGFTVTTPGGTPVTVTTSAVTVVSVSNASLGQLQAGARTLALGTAGPNGTLAGLAVVQPPDWPAGAHASVSVKSCSRDAINHEILALSSGG